ncbi:MULTISPECIES: MerC domain-containing protein [Sphingomonas]|uniref:MerC domain-containing protein n=1 Tax=Sphingomonas olei TaxID=1886787 RepID=A0ABY2QIY9_9SPHN|nr:MULTISPECIES: MerC domain-containing protein [Sphingomonas]KKI17442.1 membrane protein [Sphingomonas sp. Ag1]THG39546.1 MerC domain-containing protein [Sphingomonas olei]
MATMSHPASTARLDRLAIIVSGLCVVHCIASAVLIAMLSAVGGMMVDPIFHEVGLMLAIVLGAIGLGRGALQHGNLWPIGVGSLGLGIMAGALSLPHDAGLVHTGEAFWTIVGVALLALGHDLNRRADA